MIPVWVRLDSDLKGLGDSKVHDLDRAVVEDADIRRLDVAVDDVPPMGVGQPLCHGHEDVDLARNRHRVAALDQFVQVLSAQKFLDDVRDAVFDPEVVDGRDVPVVEVAGELRLAEEPALDLLVVQLTGLDGDRALDEGIAPAVNGAEAADTDLIENLVLSDLVRQDSPGDALLKGSSKFKRSERWASGYLTVNCSG